MAVLAPRRRPPIGRPPASSHSHVQVADRAVPAVRRQWLALLAGLTEGFDAEHAAQLAAHSTPAIAASATAPELAVAKRLPSLTELAGTLADVVRGAARRVFGIGGVPHPTPGIQGSFAFVNDRAVTWAQNRAGQLVSGVDAQTRQTIAMLVARGQNAELTVDDIAHQIKPLIGLTTPQAVAAANYRDALATRALTDRLGQDAAGALRNSYTLSPWRGGPLDGRVDRLWHQYIDRQLAYRAEAIARTETIAAATEGRRLAWDAEIQAGGVDGHRLVQTWSVTDDDRTCPECLAMDGAVIESEDIGPGRRQPIDSMGSFPGGSDGPPLHTSCRCVVTYVVE